MIGVVRLLRDRLHVSKLPARRIGRSRETQTKEFNYKVSEIGSTDFENNMRDSIRFVSLPRIKVKEGDEKIIMKKIIFKKK